MTSWTDSLSVWRSWKCQLLRAERTITEVVVDAVALERMSSATTVVAAGAPFAVRVARDEVNAAALDVLTGWAYDLESVLILGGRHGRQNWLCLSRRHDRLVLVGTSWTVRPTGSGDDLARRLPAAVGLEQARTAGGPPPVAQRTLIDAHGGQR
jgi:hypothetical protein